MAIDQLAERYGYTQGMDETIEIVQEQKWCTKDSFADITNNIQTIYNSLPTSKEKDDFRTSIAAGLTRHILCFGELFFTATEAHSTQASYIDKIVYAKIYMFSLILSGQTDKSKSSCLPTYKCYYYNYKSRLLLPAFLFSPSFLVIHI